MFGLFFYLVVYKIISWYVSKVGYPFSRKYAVGFSLLTAMMKSPPHAPKLLITPLKSGNKDS